MVSCAEPERKRRCLLILEVSFNCLKDPLVQERWLKTTNVFSEVMELSNQDLKYLYNTAQLATTLNIGRSTVNKYTRSLEEAGYEFLKDGNNHRTYGEHDIITLRALMELLARGVDYGSAVIDTVARYKPFSRSESVLMVASSGSASDVATLEATFTTKIDELMYAVTQLNGRITEIVDERVRSEVAAATAGISGQVNEVLNEVRTAQQQLSELGSRIDQHGKRKKFLGLF
ncbi:biotin operon repressor [Paenibacillus sp. PastF-3]|nr:biotin operon repressor [Paenibacillus sp. PastF-3]